MDCFAVCERVTNKSQPLALSSRRAAGVIVAESFTYTSHGQCRSSAARGQPYCSPNFRTPAAARSTRSAIPALSNRSTAATALSSERGWLGDSACLAPGELHVERTGALLGPGDDLLHLDALADWPGYADLQRHLVEAQRDRDRRIGWSASTAMRGSLSRHASAHPIACS